MDALNNKFFQGVSRDQSVDFVITYDEKLDEYIADIFESKTEKPNDAYVDTFTFKTLTSAVNDLNHYQLYLR